MKSPSVRGMSMAALIAVLVGVSAVSAGTITHTASVPLQSTNWSSTMSVPKFDPAADPACNTLVSVEVKLHGHVEGTAKFESLDGDPTTVTVKLQSDITLKRPDNTTILLSQPLVSKTESVLAHDGIIDFDGDSGRTYVGLAGDVTDTIVLSNQADLLAFTGAGNYEFPVVATATSTGSGAGNLMLQFNTNASADVEVTYNCEAADWGDLPDSSTGGTHPNYVTRFLDDGPRHIITPGLYLGACVDSEPDGQPSLFADGDDNNVGGTTTGACQTTGDDEDSVQPTPGFIWTQYGFGKVDVSVMGTGCLTGWIDWDGDGGFANSFDRIIEKVPVTSGTVTHPFLVPIDPTGKALYARFRLYPRDPGGVCTTIRQPTGLASGGEVEDYLWSFGTTAVTLRGFEASRADFQPAGWIAGLARLLGLQR